MLLQLGTTVHCTDGNFGELADFVILPVTRRVTHVVVAPPFHHSQARLVPIELIGVSEGTPGLIELRCTTGEARALPAIQAYAHLRLAETPAAATGWDLGIQQAVTLSTARSLDTDSLEPHVSLIYDRVPVGAVEVRRKSEITGAGGEWIGYLDGVTVDPAGAIKDVVIEHGHLPGRQCVSVPSSSVARVDLDGLTLTLSREQLDARVAVGNAGGR
ncbi:MAG: hypothetical protein QOD65_1989 [Gaiellales bacterium]|jgi:hypothetical protein|nr:hypothetical protein [Gaiellales bacterium]